MHYDSITGLEPSRRNSARNRKALIVGFSLSALFHAVVLLGWRTPATDLQGSLAAGPRAGDFRAAEGGGEIIAIAIAPPRPIEIPAPPAEVLLADLQVADAPERRIQPVDLAGPEGGAMRLSDRSGPGLVGADGGGDSGANAEGRDRNSLATPRSIVPRVGYAPEEMRGMTISIRVHVSARGEPTGAVIFEPSIPDAGFEKRLRDDFLGMDYEPASRNGRPVADWMEMSMSF